MMSMEEMINNSVNMIFLLTIYMVSSTHIMNNLVIIEFMTVTVLIMMFKVMLNMEMENYVILYFVVIMISESILGLSMVISMIRTHSNDFLKSLNIMKF